MAGHSKYKNIMYRKGAQDKKRSTMFSKLSREITVAAKMGLPDPEMNARLRAAVLAAKAQSVPKENIQRSIDKASASDAENYEEIRYEGFGPGGVSLIVEALSDNRNRTATNVRTAFSKNGGNLGASGSVSHGFERMGLIEYGAKAGDGDMKRYIDTIMNAGNRAKSLVTQILMIFAVRTRRRLFASRPGLGVAVLAAGAVAFTLALPVLPLGAWFGLVAPPVRYFAALLPVVAGFLVATELAKRLFYARLLGKQPAAARPGALSVPAAT